MDKLIDYICEELEELERKADKGGKLSMSEIQYGDMLAHFKKNLLTAEAMGGEEGEYNNASGNSYARGGGRGRGRNARRDSMGRYSSEGGQGGQGGGSYRQGGGSYEGSYRGGSYARGGRGGSYEGYSREDAKEDMLMQLREMEQDADEESKRMIKRWIKQVEEQ